MKYVYNKRLLLARELIKKGEKPMKTYIKCGFRDYPSFYKAFKKFFGCIPSEIRNEIELKEDPDEIRFI